MAGERRTVQEFRDELEFTRYPFADGATLVADTLQKLEKDTFLDASFYPIGAVGLLYLSHVLVTARDITLQVSDETQRVVASVAFSPTAPPDLLRLTDSYGRPAGVLVSESLRLVRFGAWNTGTHAFTKAAATFVASTSIPTPEPGVRGLLTAQNELLTGDVWLIGDNGVVVRAEEGDIRIDIVGDPLFLRKLCQQVSRFTVPNFIRTINGCPPDRYGNFNLTVGGHLAADTIVRVYADSEGLVIEAVGETTTKRGT